MGTDPTPEDPRTNPRAPGAPPTLLDGPYPFLSPPDRPGELGRLGRYRVVKLLGKGGMGFVFRAEDDGLCRPVALKVMRPEIATQPTYRERFLRGDGRAAAAIKSDHVITIFEVGEANGVIFLAMEFLAGQNLDDWLKGQPTPAPVLAVVRVAKDVLKGLVAAHAKGLIHRDIKPANLWVETESNRIKLLDFGLTRNAGADWELTHTGQVLGTPAYMAPEQARGLSLDARADLFSVGVVLFRMITGRSPFIFGEAFDPLPRVSSLGAGLPDKLATLIDRLLAKRPEDRPESANAALAVVAEVERQLRPGRPTPSTEVSVIPATPPHPPSAVPSDLSQSEVYELPNPDDAEQVPERKPRGPARVGIVAVGVVVMAILVACVLMWTAGPNRRGDGTGKEVAAGGPWPTPAATMKGEMPPEPPSLRFLGKAADAQRAKRVRILLIADTTDPGIGELCRIGLRRMKAVLELQIDEADRGEILTLVPDPDGFSGKDVILDKIQSLGDLKNQSLVCYYLGHGAVDMNSEHYLELYGTRVRLPGMKIQRPLYRKDLLTAMRGTGARLRVFVTDAGAAGPVGKVPSIIPPPVPADRPMRGGESEPIGAIMVEKMPTLESLFLRYRGEVDINAASPPEDAWFFRDYYGGIFSYAFTELAQRVSVLTWTEARGFLVQGTAQNFERLLQQVERGDVYSREVSNRIKTQKKQTPLIVLSADLAPIPK